MAKSRNQAGTQARRDPLLPVFIGLGLLVLAAYSRVFGHDFTRFDDNVYVTENPFVLGGLAADTVAWAWTSGYASNWHPLTWLSLMLDTSLFGTGPRGYHATNVLLHLANTLLLLHVCRRYTGRFWPAALIAAIFGLHPLHVESVAWIAERKDVLSTLFWLICMLAYLRYVELRQRGRYLLVLLWLACGLMAKPMLVTLPCVFLLLDFWPLGRCTWGPAPVGNPRLRALAEKHRLQRTIPQLWLEKVPMFGVILVSAVITFVVQQRGGAVASFERYSFAARLLNTPLAYLGYLRRTLWPVDLAFFYPHPGETIAVGSALAAAALLLLITAVLIWQWRRLPWALVGWLWFLGSLVPVIGLVQVGDQALADRYMYVPQIGLSLILVWPLLLRFPQLPRRPVAGAAVGAAVLLLLACLTWRQAGTWASDAALCQQGLRVTQGNYKAHNNLGHVYEQQQDLARALEHYQQAARLHAGSEYYLNIGNVQRKLGDIAAAESSWREAIQLDPDSPPANNNLGLLYLQRREFEQARRHFEVALAADPNRSEVHISLAALYLQLGQAAAAAEHARTALRLRPSSAEAKANLDQAERLLQARQRQPE